MDIAKEGIGNALTSKDRNHVIAVANDIYDETLEKYQSEINAEVGQGDGVYDISAAYPSASPFASLQDALTAFTDTTKQKPGMTIKYIDSESGKYVQYMLTKSTFSTDESDWIETGGYERYNQINFLLNQVPLTETEDDSSDVEGFIVLASGSGAGYLYPTVESVQAAYRKIDVEGYNSVRYLGIVQASGNSGEAGAAFYDETADPSTTANTGFIKGIPFDVGTSQTKGTKEYNVKVPAGAKYLYVVSRFYHADISTFSDDFYCYLQAGSPIASKEYVDEVKGNLATETNARKDLQASIEAKLDGITSESVKDNSQDNEGYIVLASGISAGNLYQTPDSVQSAYRKIDVEGVNYVRFLGLVQKSGNSGVVGCAFYDETANPTTSSNTGFIQGVPFEVGNLNVITLKEYNVKVPAGAKYLYVISKFYSVDIPTFSDDFYCYLASGNPAVSKEYVDEIKDGFVKHTYDDVAMISIGEIATEDWSSGFQENKNTIRVLVDVKEGQLVTANMPLGRGCALQVYTRRTKAISAGLSVYLLQNISDGIFASGVSNVRIENDGVLAISLRKLDNAIFTLEDYNAYLAALQFSVTSYGVSNLATELLQQNKKPLFIGTLVNRTVESTKLSDNINNARASMQSEVCFPYQGIRLYVKIKDGYSLGLRVGSTRNTLETLKSWYKNGDVIDIPDNCLYYRCFFSKGSSQSDNITVSEVEELIKNGEIEICYEDKHDIIQANIESEKYIKSLLRYFFNVAEGGTSTAALGLNGKIPNIPTFGHTSDIHGDVTRFSQFLDYCDYIGVDAALISGDFVANTPSQCCQYINDVADEHKTMVLPCTGNHDCYGLTTAQAQREQIVGYLMDKHDVVTNSLETYPTYFYKDIADKNIRVISLNTYEGNRSGHNCNFSQQQCEWFINVLANTPANYGVIVMFHSPESQPQVEGNYDAFYQNKYAYGLYYQDGITGTPISKIIDAFISGISTTVSYTSNSTAITVNAVFSSLNSGVEFIAYVTGHQHIDWVGLVDKRINGITNRQLMLNVVSTCVLGTDADPYAANLSDLSRDSVGSTQDAFNIYGIDRINKTVRIVRVGSNINFEGKERKFMIIPYANL